MKQIAANIQPLPTLTPDDTQNFVDWVTSIQNDFDPQVMGYPRTVMCQATADNEPFAYVPMQPVLMCESLAPQPGTPVLQLARGLQAIGDVIDAAGRDCGFGETFFITNSEAEMQLCAKRGWTVSLHDIERGKWLLKRKLPSPDYRPS